MGRVKKKKGSRDVGTEEGGTGKRKEERKNSDYYSINNNALAHVWPVMRMVNKHYKSKQGAGEKERSAHV